MRWYSFPDQVKTVLSEIADSDGMNCFLRKVLSDRVQTPMAKKAAQSEMAVLIAECLRLQIAVRVDGR
ncbi:MAG: hypothetical protein HRT88_19080 [Lentisphaeraceae bacterium]|nr:hypothetical protein [Lentisphaeraceae bacterium]